MGSREPLKWIQCHMLSAPRPGKSSRQPHTISTPTCKTRIPYVVVGIYADLRLLIGSQSIILFRPILEGDMFSDRTRGGRADASISGNYGIYVSNIYASADLS